MHACAKHRIVIDAPTPHGAGEAVLFANNLYDQTKQAYKGSEKDLAIVIVLRHFGTPFGYNDTIWAKYGKQMGAKYYVTGHVSGADERSEDMRRVQYFLYLEVVNVETSEKLFLAKSEITKAIR